MKAWLAKIGWIKGLSAVVALAIIVGIPLSNAARYGVTPTPKPSEEISEAEIEQGKELFDDVWKEEAEDDPRKTPNPAGGSPSPTPSSGVNPYQIYVSKNSYTIAILGLDESGEYTKVLRRFSTGIGRSSAQTRTGSFVITGKQRWHAWSGTAYSPYATKYSGGVYFHGPIYNAMDSNRMKPGSYNEIGTACSSGCLRTTCSAAAWVYYNCRVGTTVVVANDSKYTSSRPAHIPSTQTWDPTDPGATPEIPVTSFSVSVSPNPIEMWNTAQVHVSNIAPADTSTTSFSYASSDTDIVTVDGSGRLTAKAVGSATIRVTANDVNGQSRTVSVTVVLPVLTPTPSTEPTPTASIELTPTPTASLEPTPTPEPTLDPSISPGPSESPAPSETPDPSTSPGPSESPSQSPEGSPLGVHNLSYPPLWGMWPPGNTFPLLLA
jgi:lipoprotein-anchoring transpeptidase ErfK/SrfK